MVDQAYIDAVNLLELSQQYNLKLALLLFLLAFALFITYRGWKADPKEKQGSDYVISKGFKTINLFYGIFLIVATFILMPVLGGTTEPMFVYVMIFVFLLIYFMLSLVLGIIFGIKTMKDYLDIGFDLVNDRRYKRR